MYDVHPCSTQLTRSIRGLVSWAHSSVTVFAVVAVFSLFLDSPISACVLVAPRSALGSGPGDQPCASLACEACELGL